MSKNSMPKAVSPEIGLSVAKLLSPDEIEVKEILPIVNKSVHQSEFTKKL